MATVCSILHHVFWLAMSLWSISCVCWSLELYADSNFYAKQPVFQEYLIAGVVNGYDKDTLFTLCFTAEGIATWDGKDRISAINEEAKRCSRKNEWGGMFHFMALASILEWPMHSIYLNTASRIRVSPQKDPPTCFDPGGTRHCLHHVVTWWRSRFNTWKVVPTKPFYSHFQSASCNRFKLENPLNLSRCNWRQTFPVKKRHAKGHHYQFFSRVEGPPKNQSKDQTMRWNQKAMLKSARKVSVPKRWMPTRVTLKLRWSLTLLR